MYGRKLMRLVVSETPPQTEVVKLDSYWNILCLFVCLCVIFVYCFVFVFVISTKIIEYMCYQDERNIYIRNYMYIDSTVEPRTLHVSFSRGLKVVWDTSLL